jgi:hypothetical protein
VAKLTFDYLALFTIMKVIEYKIKYKAKGYKSFSYSSSITLNHIFKTLKLLSFGILATAGIEPQSRIFLDVAVPTLQLQVFQFGYLKYI